MENVSKKNDYSAILKNKDKYDNIKIKLLKNACKKLGYNVFKDFDLPQTFNYDCLNADYFNKTYTQTMSIPLTDNVFKMLTKLPKKAINTPFVFNSKDKRITGQYLLGNYNNKPVLYALSIIQNEKNANTEFNLKLDVCINGKEWIQLARFDSSGAPHPNYYDENTYAKNSNEINYVPAPHMHYCIQRSQVLNGTKFDFMPAKHIEIEKLKNNNLSFVENSMKYFLDYTNIQEDLNLTALSTKDYGINLFNNCTQDSRFIYSHQDALNFLNEYFNQQEKDCNI